MRSLSEHANIMMKKSQGLFTDISVLFLDIGRIALPGPLWSWLWPCALLWQVKCEHQ